MTDKYIDLDQAIIDANDVARDYMCSCYDSGVEATLKYLDEHPDQVPGRTIAESEFKEAFPQFVPGRTAARFVKDGLSVLGITVVPDPEPSNVEKLEKIVWDMDGPLGHIGRDRADLIVKWLDAAGVKAPGGDDDV